MTVASKLHNNNAVKDVSLYGPGGRDRLYRRIDGNGQTELVYG